MSDNWNTLHQAAFEPESFMSKAFTTEDFCTRSSLHRRPFTPETRVHHKQKPFTTERFDTNSFFSKQRLTPEEDFCTTSLLPQKPFAKHNWKAHSQRKPGEDPLRPNNGSQDTLIQHNYAKSHNILLQWQKLTLHHRHQFCSFFILFLCRALSLSDSFCDFLFLWPVLSVPLASLIPWFLHPRSSEVSQPNLHW